MKNVLFIFGGAAVVWLIATAIGWQMDQVRDVRLAHTPLHDLAQNHLVREMREQIERFHADVNARDTQGETALFTAARCGDVDSIRVLLDADCNPTITNLAGMTALDAAINAQRTDAIQVLQIAIEGKRGEKSNKMTAPSETK
ncbi:MAG: ankyrin repeat domain-containing protein [Verrucomicrobiales bacterium]|nr:ankyrin repeat domain-containing protein [Verrucomicrobiales bacterium]